MTQFALWASIKSLIDTPTTLDEAFRKLPMFENLTRKQMKEIERIVHWRTYRAGEVIFHTGDTGVALYVIIAGEVRIVLPGDNPGEGVEIARLSSGDLFGELALLDSSPRSASAVAGTPTEVATLARPDWLDLIQRQPAIGVEMLLPLAKMIAVRLRAANKATVKELREAKASTEK